MGERCERRSIDVTYDVPDEIGRLLEGHDGLNGQLSQGAIELLEQFLLLRMIFIQREDLIAPDRRCTYPRARVDSSVRVVRTTF